MERKPVAFPNKNAVLRAFSNFFYCAHA